MPKPLIKIFDAISQEEIVREMNDEEYAQYLKDTAESQEPVNDQSQN